VQSVEGLQTYSSFLIDTLYPVNRDIINLETRENETVQNEAGEIEYITYPERLVNGTYFNAFNYYCGMQVNIRESRLVKNTHQQSKRVVSHLKPIDYDGIEEMSGVSLFG